MQPCCNSPRFFRAPLPPQTQSPFRLGPPPCHSTGANRPSTTRDLCRTSAGGINTHPCDATTKSRHLRQGRCRSDHHIRRRQKSGTAQETRGPTPQLHAPVDTTNNHKHGTRSLQIRCQPCQAPSTKHMPLSPWSKNYWATIPESSRKRALAFQGSWQYTSCKSQRPRSSLGEAMCVTATSCCRR
jgi:hypothetical protein